MTSEKGSPTITGHISDVNASITLTREEIKRCGNLVYLHIECTVNTALSTAWNTQIAKLPWKSTAAWVNTIDRVIQPNGGADDNLQIGIALVRESTLVAGRPTGTIPAGAAITFFGMYVTSD